MAARCLQALMAHEGNEFDRAGAIFVSQGVNAIIAIAEGLSGMGKKQRLRGKGRSGR